MKQRLVIVGVGMMGGSLGLAIKKRGLPYEVIGLGRNLSRLKKAVQVGACDRVTVNYSQGLKDADMAVVCTPVHQVVPQVQRIASYIKPSAVVTDIASVKSSIVEGVQALAHPPHHFVGSHPLAGSEKTGVEFSDPNLYQGATVVLTPFQSSKSAVRSVKKLWNSVGASALSMEAPIHDLAVAQTSHLPHVLSAGFSHLIAVLQKKDPNVRRLLAGSFKDFTRIADSDPDQWAEICQSNHQYLAGALQAYRDILNHLIKVADCSEDRLDGWRRFFSTAKEERAQLLERKK